MNVDKIRNLTDIELAHQQRDMADQLFKMKFQLKMGQTESLKKIRELKKDIARVQTVLRQKELAGGNGAAASASNPVKKTVTAKKAASKMAKTIVVEVRRQKAHPFYKRVVARSKKFYAHDEDGTAHLGDFVKLEETRPLSKLKRWQLKEIVRRAAQIAPVEAKPAS